MAQQVPQEITIGGTTYRHTPIGNKDWFTADGKDGQGEHMWMYNIDSARNAVYFANKATSAVVWTLPDINKSTSDSGVNDSLDSGEAPAMRVKGANPSSRWSSANNTPLLTPVDSNRASSRPSSALGVREPSSGSTPASENNNDISPKTHESARERIRERLRNKLGTTSLASQSRSSANSPNPASSSSTPAVATATAAEPKEPQAAEERKASEESTTASSLRGSRPMRSRASTMLSTRSSESAASVGSDISALEEKMARGEQLTARERLALRRAGRHAGRASPNPRSASPAANEVAETTKAGGEGVRSETTTPNLNRSFGNKEVAQNDSAADTSRVSASPHEGVATAVNNGAQAAFEKQLAEERRRQIIEADVQLQAEREELIRQERIAIERAKRLQEAQLREQELMLKAMSERRVMEERRAELEKQQTQKREQSHQRAGRASSVPTETELANNLVLATTSGQYESEPSTPLIGAGSLKRQSTSSVFHAGGPKRGHHGAAAPGFSSGANASQNVSVLEARVLDALARGRSKGDELDGKFGDEFDDQLGGEDDDSFQKTATAPAQAPVRVGGKPKDVSYNANHSYSGTMYGKMKHGHGLYRYNSSELDKEGNPLPSKRDQGVKPILYDGAWERNKKQGEGVISLPNSLYEGDWAEDLPHGKGMLQTQNMKAEAKFRKGKATGGAIIQMRSGATYSGVLKQGKVATPGAIQLTSRDKIEWKWSDPAVAGSGEVVISFANGDHYAGTIRGYVLHGAGYLRFSVAPSSVSEGKATTTNATASSSSPTVGFHEYSGMFSNGIMEGHGVYKFDSGAMYEGAMKGGLFHGTGTFSAPVTTASSSSQVAVGGVGNSTPVGLNKTAPPDTPMSSVSVSPMTNSSPPVLGAVGESSPRDLPSRSGVPAYIYTGEWRQGKMHGRGVITYSNGDVWEGTFSSDRRVEGRYTYSEQFQLVAKSSHSQQQNLQTNKHQTGLTREGSMSVKRH